MRLKTSNLKDPKHTDLVSCVSWMSPDDVVSIADDGKILKWNLVSAETTQIGELPEGSHPTDIHWYPRGQGGGGGGPGTAGGKGKGGAGTAGGRAGAADQFLVTTAEGRLILVGKSARLEKTVETHRGACLAARWSHDGAGIVTGGEDGTVKIWSRSGMLRSTLAHNTEPVYGLAWSPDASQVR